MLTTILQPYLLHDFFSDFQTMTLGDIVFKRISKRI